jgi:hypothetical protein
MLGLSLQGEVPDVGWPLSADHRPPTLAILDLLQFCHRTVAKAIRLDLHSYYGHHHLEFDHDAGQAAFRADANRILARNGLVYELQADGSIVRLAPEGLREALQDVVFRTGDGVLDTLLETARTKFLHPDVTVRHEALEKLWDAWERVKTLEPGKDKKESAGCLLDRVASEPMLRDVLEREAQELTRIGNTFMIRHTETGKVPVQTSEQVDFFFHRLFALLRFVLRATGRGG